MKISMIAAVAENNVIGKDNDLAWNLPDDMKYFMNTTQHHFVIMGRKNYESLPPKFRPLPNRTNIIITRKAAYHAPGSVVVHSLEESLEYCNLHQQQEIFVIGGGQIYDAALDKADSLYITEVAASVEGDTYFPKFNRDEWRELSRVHHPADDRHEFAFDFVIYERK